MTTTRRHPRIRAVHARDGWHVTRTQLIRGHRHVGTGWRPSLTAALSDSLELRRVLTKPELDAMLDQARRGIYPDKGNR